MKEKTFTKVEHRYIVASEELKKKLGIKGVILNICLYQGVSPYQEGIKRNKDLESWEILTEE